ncbi:MAG: YigZ family protein, partial [Haliscomenobacter sp.]
FGGTLLGTSGLINAYRTAAAEAIQAAEIREKKVESQFELTFHYALMNDIMNSLKKLDVRVVEQEFGEGARLIIAIPRSAVSETFLRLKAMVAHVHLEEAALIEEINGLEIRRVPVNGE